MCPPAKESPLQDKKSKNSSFHKQKEVDRTYIYIRVEARENREAGKSEEILFERLQYNFYMDFMC